MGIKDLTQFLKKLEPELFVQVPLEKFSGHNFAVDASIFLYKFKCVTAQFSGNWIDMFIALVQWLRKWDITPIFVFDGAPPEEKSATQQERRERKAQIVEKIETIKGVLKQVSEAPLNSALSNDLTAQVNEFLKVDTSEMMPRKQVIFELDALYKRVSGQSVRISGDDIKQLQAILGAMGLRCLNATGEAERACAWLMHKGHVSAVLTNDSDILVYGETVLVQDVKPNKTDCTVIRHCDILEATGFTSEQFRDFCIMCGMDYNARIPKIGPAKAYELLRKRGSIEEIVRGEGLDARPLRYERVRELLTIRTDDEKLLFKETFNGNPPIPNRKELEMLLLRNNSRYPPEQLVNYKARFTVA